MTPTPKQNVTSIRLIYNGLKSRPYTVQELQALIKGSRSTVYRYLRILTESGVEVRRVGMNRPTQYHIEKS